MATDTKIIRASDGQALADRLKKSQNTLQSLLGSKEMAIRAWRVAYVLVRRNPELQKCSVESVVDGMLQSAQLDLELGTEAYLVPFKGTAVFIPDWKGLVRLAIRAGAITSGHAALVYEGDEYRYRRTGVSVEFYHERSQMGTNVAPDTVEAHRTAGCRGTYFIGYTPSGPPIVAEASVDEIEYVRTTYSKEPKGLLWGKRWSVGAYKTVTKQGLKLVAQSPDLQKAIELDNRFETGIQTAVLDGDDHAVRPLQEPKAKQSPGQQEQQALEEDAKLAEEER
jgi:phage RecT family recombinase